MSAEKFSLSQEDAQQLFHHGATLVFLDVPEGTDFGIDYNTWAVGPKFRGVKMIPPGFHFVYYRFVTVIKVMLLCWKVMSILIGKCGFSIRITCNIMYPC